MCGIAGFISRVHDKATLQSATDCLAHRGPDGDGLFFSQANNLNIGLGHRRLSIIDLSTAAGQPMQSHCGRYTMIFNGEIYNFREIKNTKFPADAVWKSTGDTEVIIESFAKYGAQSFAWLNGMFAIAIWDSKDHKLTLARDHIGIKPFYYYYDQSELFFASELKAITKTGKKLAVNFDVIPAFLHLGYIPHPYSIYQHVMKLGAGSYAEITTTNGTLSFKETSFWKITDKISEEVLQDEALAKKKLDELLTSAVQMQLISDVPIGTFLSGGTDSSIVTALAAKVSPGKINTYSIAVKDGKVNEAPYAAAVAAHLKTDHHELPITQKELLEMVPSFMAVYDEPFSDSSAFPTMLVSKLARQNVTVALSGDGGDELFLGYGSYLWAKRLQNPLARLLAPAVYQATRFLNSRYKRVGMLFQGHDPAHFKSHLFSQDQYYFSEKELEKLLIKPTMDFSSINKSYTGRKLNIQEETSFWDIENYLKDDLLVKVDRASMQYSLETRVPLLDYRVVEFALNLSSSLKINEAGVMKYLLKELLYDYVPKQLLDRPKWGFSIPMVKWLKTDLKWMIDKYCSEQLVRQTGIVKYEVVKDIVKEYFNGSDYLYKRIWALIVLHWYFYEHA